MNATENRAKLLDRAKKLFALSQDSANEHEASIAMKRLSSMMAKHGFTESELQQSDNHQFNDVNAGKSFRSPIPKWYSALALAAGNISDTVSYMNTKGKERTMRFRGFQGDDQIAVMLFEYLLEVQARELKKYKKETGAKGADALFAFRIGFASRMCKRSNEIKADREAEQQAASTTGTSLIVIKNQLITDHFSPLTKARKSRGTKVMDSDAYNAGKDAGDRVSLNKQVGGSAAVPALT